MNETISYRYHLPNGGELQELLDQPYITGSILRKLLQRRGTFINSQEKTDLVAYLKLTLLRPDEFNYLMEIAVSREERRKARNDFDECPAGDTTSFAICLPDADNLNIDDFIGRKLPNCSIFQAPIITQESTDKYRLFLQLRRHNLASNWLKSDQIFPAEVEIVRDTAKGTVRTTAWHTSQETRHLTRHLVRELRSSMIKNGVIKNEEPFSLRFRDFTNEQRISFLMKYTSSFNDEFFSFSKLTDLSLKLDEGVPCEDERLSWMRNQVSALNVKGKALQKTFFVSDPSCQKHLFVWRFGCRYEVDSANGRATVDICLEFGGYGRSGDISAPFQLTCTNIGGRGYKGSFKALEKKVVSSLNDYQKSFYDGGFKRAAQLGR